MYRIRIIYHSLCRLWISSTVYKIPEIEKVISKFPNIKFGRKWGHKLLDGIIPLHMSILYPSKNYSNPEDFLNKEIIPKIPKEEMGNGFIAIIPISGTEIFTYPKSKDGIIDSKIKESYDSISSIKTGLPLVLGELLVETFDEEAPIDELLSIIPFNIFVPDLSQRAKNFIIDNYEDIKMEFNITTLFDWAAVNSNDLTNKLITLDKDKNPRKRMMKEPDWKNAVGKIIEGAKKHKDAIDNNVEVSQSSPTK